MATKKTAQVQENINIEIPGLDIREFDLKIIGTSPLIMHAWSTKAKVMMLDKQMKKASAGKDAKRPMVDFAEALHWISKKPDLEKLSDSQIVKEVQKGRFGFPTTGFKASAINAAYQQGAIEKKTTARGAFFVDGELAEIKGEPVPREDMVRIGMGTADIRYRAEFPEWETTLHIRYNARSISIEQILNLFNIGGFACGVGDWRPQKDGQFGMYKVA